jgi:hypothetical protein
VDIVGPVVVEIGPVVLNLGPLVVGVGFVEVEVGSAVVAVGWVRLPRLRRAVELDGDEERGRRPDPGQTAGGVRHLGITRVRWLARNRGSARIRLG